MKLLAALATVTACWGVGRCLFHRLGIRLHSIEHDLLSAFSGAALVSLYIFLLCTLRLASPLALALPLGFLRFLRPVSRPALSSLPRQALWLFCTAFAFYAVIYLANSLAPEKSPDGMAYHLGLVAHYLRHQGFDSSLTNMYGYMPQGLEMLFLPAFAFGGHAAAATVHCATLLALPWLMLTYTRRIGQPWAGVSAAGLVFLSPLAGIDGTSAYNDVALAGTAFALFYLLEIWRETPNPRLLIPIGLLAGFCFSIKYTGFAASLYALAVVRRRITPGMVVSAAAIALPWLAKNWLTTGNPVSPLFNAVFPNPFIHLTFETFYRAYFHTYNLPSLLPLPWMLTVTGELGGQLGPLFLLAPLGILAAKTRPGRYILLAAACFLLPWPANLGARFLLPVLPFAALSIALALPSWRPLTTILVASAAFLAWPRVIDKYRAPAGGWQVTTVPWQAALGLIPERTWLLARSGEFELADLINRTVPPTATLWSTNVLAESYIKANVLVNYYSARGEAIEDTLNIPLREDLHPTWNWRFTFPSRTVSTLRVFQSATSDTDIWSLGEAHFYSGTLELRPLLANANPFPWDVHLALDNNPTTRWRSWQPIRPGMFLDFIFPTNTTLDRVELAAAHDQWKLDLRLDNIPATLEKLELPPLPDLRRQATQTIKSRGIDYLLIGRNAPQAADMKADPARWGLRLAAAKAGDALYQIQ